MIRLLGIFAVVVAVSLLTAFSAGAACNVTCQDKCKRAVANGYESSYAACVKKWGGINTKGADYAAEKEKKALKKKPSP